MPWHCLSIYIHCWTEYLNLYIWEDFLLECLCLCLRVCLCVCLCVCHHGAIVQYTSLLPSLFEFTCAAIARAGLWCLPIAFPGCFEAFLKPQNAAQCDRDHVCSVWDCENVSKLGKSWKREPFWPRLREKAAAAPRSPSLFSPPANENPAFFSAYLCHFTKTKTFKALLLDILCIVMQLYGHAQHKLKSTPSWEIDSVKVMMRIILWGMWNRADLTKALSFYSSHAHAMLDAWINCQLIHSKYFHRWFMIINRDHS